MKTVSLLLLVFLQGTSFSAADRHVSFDNPEADLPSGHKWLPVVLTDAEREILSKRSMAPQTALDYYLVLSTRYFGNIACEVERRVTFIDKETLSDQYLNAEYTIPATDRGAFRITIRLFNGNDGTIASIAHRAGTKSLCVPLEGGPAKLSSISLGLPEFWRYREGALLRASDSILPEVRIEDILDRYRNHYKAHLNYPTQMKFIWLDYKLPQKGNIVQVTGRENFMDPRKKYVWAEFAFNGDRFVPSTISEQDGTDQPATRSESKSEAKDNLNQK